MFNVNNKTRILIAKNNVKRLQHESVFIIIGKDYLCHWEKEEKKDTRLAEVTIVKIKWRQIVFCWHMFVKDKTVEAHEWSLAI